MLGAQAAGEKGVERRIDVIAQAIQMKATVFDLEEAELCYAPQYGSAKDPVNFAGMIAANAVRGDVEFAPWGELDSTSAFLLDVRDPNDFAAGAIAGSVNIPLGQLRRRMRNCRAVKGNLGDLRRGAASLLCLPDSRSAWSALAESLGRIQYLSRDTPAREASGSPGLTARAVRTDG